MTFGTDRVKLIDSLAVSLTLAPTLASVRVTPGIALSGLGRALRDLERPVEPDLDGRLGADLGDLEQLGRGLDVDRVGGHVVHLDLVAEPPDPGGLATRPGQGGHAVRQEDRDVRPERRRDHRVGLLARQLPELPKVDGARRRQAEVERGVVGVAADGIGIGGLGRPVEAIDHRVDDARHRRPAVGRAWPGCDRSGGLSWLAPGSPSSRAIGRPSCGGPNAAVNRSGPARNTAKGRFAGLRGPTGVDCPDATRPHRSG